ncbi:MAG: hypothetical protein AABW61_00415, partial [Candidatus Aenigmatarchaeota archaeon]
MSLEYEMIGELKRNGIIDNSRAEILRMDVEEGVPLRNACIERRYTTPETYATVLSFLTGVP